MVTGAHGAASWDCRQAADSDQWTCDSASADATAVPASEASAGTELESPAPTEVPDAPANQPEPETDIPGPAAVAAVSQPPVESTSTPRPLADEPDDSTGEAENPVANTSATDKMLPTVEPVDEVLETPVAEDPYGEWALCPPVPDRGITFTDEEPDDDAIITQMTGLQATVYSETIFELHGKAAIQRGNQRIAADQLVYDSEAGVLDAKGNVQLDEPDYSISGSSARMLVNQDQGEIYDVEYQAFRKHARGTSEVLTQKNKNWRRFKKATYTTCPPGSNAWALKGRKVILEDDKGEGTGKHVFLKLKDVPVFYTPYLSFPLDDRRKTGFLVPTYGHSQESGTDVRVPFYWNIAPNYDATITPRYLSRRGVQMIGEFRYLTPSHQGKLDAEYLPSDNKFDNRNRAFYSLEHRGKLAPRISIGARAKHVSDKTYFDDLGSSLSVTSTTHLEQTANASYAGNGWSLTTLVQNFQTVDESIPNQDRPYKRMPQLLFNMSPKPAPLGTRVGLRAETVRFDQDDRVRGTRIDLKPEFSRPFTGSAYFVTPTASLRYTTYNLDDQAPGESSSPSRTTPILSLDSGLFFDRDIPWTSKRMVQTLEPRLFYLYVPDDNQDDLPVFDTAKYDFNFGQLFRDNRFSGADRQGDANQVSVALTSRILDPASGVEKISGSIGSIVYFRDREVVLPGETSETDSTSNVVAGLRLDPTEAWQVSSGIQWDPNTVRVDRGSVNLRYWPDKGHLANLSYQYRRGVLNQIDASSLWYLTPSWHGVFRYWYSLRDDKLLEALGGVEYESCCWAFRTLVRKFVNTSEGDQTTAIMFQLELKGLTSVGHAIEDLLEEEIVGYGEAPW